MRKKIIIIVLTSVLLVTLICIYNNAKDEKIKAEQFKEVKPVLEYAEKIMKGEIEESLVEGPLDMYGFDYDSKRYQTIFHLEVSLEAEKIVLNEDKTEGYIIVNYSREGRDQNGDVCTGTENRAKWSIKKNNGEWDVIDVYDRPDGYVPGD